MKKPNEIKKALECCFNAAQCGDCPYWPTSCDRELVRDAREYIRELETEKARLSDLIDMQDKSIAELSGKVGQLEAERDAAIKDMTEIVQEYGDPFCVYCGADFKPNCKGRCWTHNEGFKWRGVRRRNEHGNDPANPV